MKEPEAPEPEKACPTGYEEYLEIMSGVPLIIENVARGDYLCFRMDGDCMDNGLVNGYAEGDSLLCREIPMEYWCGLIKIDVAINKWDFVVVHKYKGIMICEIKEHCKETKSIRVGFRNTDYLDQVLLLDNIHKTFMVVYSQRIRRK